MKTTVKLFATGLLLASAGSALAAVRYVDVNSTNSTPPLHQVGHRSSNNSACRGCRCGGRPDPANQWHLRHRWAGGNRMVGDKPLILRSVNGPQFTIIQGYWVPRTGNGYGAIRYVYLANRAGLSGFNLTNGATREGTYRQSSGGALICESTNAVVSNCVLAGNSAYNGGGGANGGTLNNCTLNGNSADFHDAMKSCRRLDFCSDSISAGSRHHAAGSRQRLTQDNSPHLV